MAVDPDYSWGDAAGDLAVKCLREIPEATYADNSCTVIVLESAPAPGKHDFTQALSLDTQTMNRVLEAAGIGEEEHKLKTFCFSEKLTGGPTNYSAVVFGTWASATPHSASGETGTVGEAVVKHVRLM